MNPALPKKGGVKERKGGVKERVVVAMSGGVDSSVAAALLQKAGYEVIGMTMCFGLTDAPKKKPACCGLQGIEDARRVCHKLGIRHYVLNMHKELNDYIIADFFRQYLSGRTPNPCVRCNQYLKFGVLLKKALSLGADYLATGHYARIVKARSGRRRAQGYLLKKSKDRRKDQSYFLYRLGQEQLKHALFPLGNYTKEQVRRLAAKFGLPVADKPASQEICFLPQADYRSFLEAGAVKKIKSGPIVDKQGKVLGQHKGIAFYTVGQRQGLGIAGGYPLYIIRIDPRHNRIILGSKKDAYQKEFLVKEPHFICKYPKKKIAVKVKIRYNHNEVLAEIMPRQNKVKVCLSQPQFAITPGQSAVFYDKDVVLGGGIIDRAL